MDTILTIFVGLIFAGMVTFIQMVSTMFSFFMLPFAIFDYVTLQMSDWILWFMALGVIITCGALLYRKEIVYALSTFLIACAGINLFSIFDVIRNPDPTNAFVIVYPLAMAVFIIFAGMSFFFSERPRLFSMPKTYAGFALIVLGILAGIASFFSMPTG